MPDALELALQNAAYNSPKDSQVHLENIESIIDPTQDEPTISEHTHSWQTGVVVPPPPQYDPRDVAFTPDMAERNAYQQRMMLEYNAKTQKEYESKVAANNATASSIHHLSVLVQGVKDDVHHIINMIQAAASMSSEPNHNHRSLHEWDDQYLINELVERENDLMPFYYELLKRIGSPELQKLVMTSMQGKNNSMVTLAQLCAAMGSLPAQSQPELSEQQRYAIQRHQRQSQSQSEQRQGSVVPEYQPPSGFTPQYFGQQTAEYIRQINSAS